MFKKILLSSLILSSSMFAHTAVMACFDNGDATITCEGGFSDGSSASGIEIYILENGQVVLESELNEDSEFTFNKPNGDYVVEFDAGEGHMITIKGKDILE